MSATRSEPPQKAASPRSRVERGADDTRPASPLKVALPTRPASSRRSAVCPPRYRTVQRAIHPEEGLDVAPLSRGVAGRCHRARLTQIHFETRYALGPSSGSRRPASRRIDCAERGESAPGCAGRPLGKLHLCANRFEPWLPAEGVIAREVWIRHPLRIVFELSKD